MARTSKALIKKLKAKNPDIASRSRKKTITKTNYVKPENKNKNHVITGDNSSLKQIKYNYVPGDLCKLRQPFFNTNNNNMIMPGEIAIIISTSTYEVLEKGKVIKRKVTKDKILVFMDYNLFEIDGRYITKI